jgi:hypothetical protein
VSFELDAKAKKALADSIETGTELTLKLLGVSQTRGSLKYTEYEWAAPDE